MSYAWIFRDPFSVTGTVVPIIKGLGIEIRLKLGRIWDTEEFLAKLGQVDFVLDDTTYGEQVGPLIASLMISP